ncbi:MAG: chaperonin GroEL [Gammaproteobacteria bacterium]
MTQKLMLFHESAREKLLQGATQLADAVRVTLGPRSKSVLIQRPWGDPLVCNDGVTIAKEAELPDAVQNLGVQMLRQAAVKTSDAVGDGTSTSVVLAHALLTEGVKNVVAGASAIALKRGLEKGCAAVIDMLHAMSNPIRTHREKMQVAAISAHNDETIGKLIADAMEQVGNDGVITVEESKTTETELETVKGMKLDRGFLSPYFVVDPDKTEAVLEDALILLCDRRIVIVQELLPLLDQVAKAGKPLLIVAEDVETEVLATLIVNNMRRVLSCIAIKAPGFGDSRKAILEDIAVLTGTRVVSEQLGLELKTTNLADLGRAARIVSDKDSTIIVGGGGNATAINTRVQLLRAQMDKTDSSYEKDKLQERIARLSGGVAVIRAGAPTESEMKARRDALDDAINATRAAVAEGTVPGGGLALLRCSKGLQKLENESSGDERTAIQILRHALCAPTRQIAENSAVDGGVVVADMLKSEGSVGFDAARNEYVDLVAAGIIDPTKVVRVALENAISVASLLLLTEATMTEIASPEPKKQAEFAA